MMRTLSALATMLVAAVPAFAQTSPSSGDLSSGGSATPATVVDALGHHGSQAALTARRAIERDGYKDVRDVAKGSDGLWHAQAMRGNTQVRVTVERSGRVSAQ